MQRNDFKFTHTEITTMYTYISVENYNAPTTYAVLLDGVQVGEARKLSDVRLYVNHMNGVV